MLVDSAGMTGDGSGPRYADGDPGSAEQRARELKPPWLSHEPRSQAALDRLRHCWVQVGEHKLPGLLLNWRPAGDIWEGRVIIPVLVDDAWAPQEAWVPRRLIEEA